MSSNKRLCLRSNEEKSQSFSERICDDLSEVILQYLPLKDKLRLECVSKQFQRTVLQKQYELTIDKIFERLLSKNNKIDLKLVESLLKKCPNLRSLKFSYYWGKGYNYSKTIKLVIKYCDNLVEFEFPFIKVNKTDFKAFHTKFGPKLKSLKAIYGQYLCELDL